MFDCHCHLDHPSLRSQLATFFEANKLTCALSCGIKPESWKAHLELPKELPIMVALGLHPFYVNENFNEDMSFLEEVLKTANVKALGEIGLDYHKEHEQTRVFQRQCLEKQLELAQLHNLPVIIHCRKAFADLWPMMKGFNQKLIMHGFSGSITDLERTLERGDMISLGFPLLYEDRGKAADMLRLTPINQLFLETDAPYMRKAWSDPAFSSSPLDIVDVYSKAAHIKGISVSELIETITSTSTTVF